MSKQLAGVVCALALGVYAVAACDGGKGMKARQQRQIRECTQALQAAVAAQPDNRIALLAEGCPWPHEGEEAAADDWSRVQRLGGWLADARSSLGSGDERLIAELDEAMGNLRFPIRVPAVAEGRYELAGSAHTQPIRARAYVVVTAGEITAGALARAELTENGARLMAAPGGPFPGKAVDLAKLAATLAEIEKAVAEPGARIAIDEEVARDGGPAGDDSHHRPLVLADAGLSAERVLEVVTRIGAGGVRVGARGEAGGAAAHAVQLDPHGGRPPSVVVIDGARVLISALGPENDEFRKQGGAFKWAAIEERLRALRSAPGTAIAAESSAPVRDLVRLLDAMAAAGFEHAGVLTAPDAVALLDRAGSGGFGGNLDAEPRVIVGSVSTVGSLDRSIIRRYIRRRRPQIRGCYEKALAGEPGLETDVTLSFEIARSGFPRAVRAEGDRRPVAACVADVVKRIRFPGGPGIVKVRFPFQFRLPKK